MAPPTCPVCKSLIRYDDVRCAACNLPYHNACTDVGAGTATASAWRCNSCRDTNEGETPMTTSHFKLLMKELAALRTSVAQCNDNTTETMQLLTLHTQQITECQTVIGELRAENAVLKDRLDCLENRMTSGASSPPTFAEISKRLEREKNLIIKGVPEGDSGDIQQICSDILKSLSPRTDAEIVSLDRIGKLSSNHPRLIKVVLSNIRTKYAILGNRKRLDRARFPNVDVLNDLTPLQAGMLRDAWEQVRLRRNNGEADLFVRFVDGQPCVTKRAPVLEDLSGGKRQREEENSPNQPPKQSKTSVKQG